MIDKELSPAAQKAIRASHRVFWAHRRSTAFALRAAADEIDVVEMTSADCIFLLKRIAAELEAQP